MIRTTFALSMMLITGCAIAQECKPDKITPSHAIGQYLDNADGTVIDIVNGLVWQKCSLGQKFKDGTCQDNPTSYTTWAEALIAGKENSLLPGQEEYRLPNIKELASLVERSCVRPSIDLNVFPATPSAIYWSNTPDNTVNVDVANGILGRLIDFSDGTEFLTDVNTFRLTRLVRKL